MLVHRESVSHGDEGGESGVQLSESLLPTQKTSHLGQTFKPLSVKFPYLKHGDVHPHVIL